MKKQLCIAAFIALIITFSLSVKAQSSFISLQGTNFKMSDTFSKMEDSLKHQFEKQKLTWPPEAMYIRSFKYDRQLEVWVKNQADQPYKLFKTYKICMQSGSTGPKRVEGDYQVPEGFYYINEMNPNSNYHLALGISYPNSSDRILGDPNRPGGNIYIHGNCVSTGCIAITDGPAEELFILASYVKAQGQEFIPVHVFPVRYNVAKSADYLASTIKDNNSLKEFNKTLKGVFDHFELKKELPVIMVNMKGEYVIR